MTIIPLEQTSLSSLDSRGAMHHDKLGHTPEGYSVAAEVVGLD